MEDRKFQQIVEEYLEFMWRSNPIWATNAGVHKYDDRLGDYSAKQIARTLQTAKEFKSRLEKDIDMQKLSKSNRIDYQALYNALSSSITDEEMLKPFQNNPTNYPDIVLYGVHLLILRDFAPLAKRAENVLSRMKQAGQILADGIKNLKNPPRIFTEIAIETTEGGLLFFKSMIPPLAEKVPALKDDLLKANQDVIKQLTQYLDYLNKDLLPRSTGNYAIGEELFNFKLKTEHFLDYDARDLFEIGKEMLKQTKAQVMAIAKRINPNKSWQEIINEMKNEHPTATELMDFYNNQMERTRNFVIDRKLASIPQGESLSVMETPLFAQPVIPYAAYMPPAPFEKEQQGFFWVTPIDTTRPAEAQSQQLHGHNKYGAIIAALHEGYPGHHLQLCRANKHQSLLRKVSGDNVFMEGWAFYCEEMMYEQGFYPDDKARLYQLKDVLWRACRVIIDVGLHTGKLSFDQAVDMLVNEAAVEKVNAISEVKRYTTSPTQPMSYLIGKLEILKIRDEYKKKRGNAFNLTEFHDKLLSGGSLSIKLLKEDLFG